MAKARFPKGIIKIEFRGTEYLAEYMGRQEGFECLVCRKGNNCVTFNILHSDNLDDYWKRGQYETWGFGRDHLHLVKFLSRVAPRPWEGK